MPLRLRFLVASFALATLAAPGASAFVATTASPDLEFRLAYEAIPLDLPFEPLAAAAPGLADGFGPTWAAQFDPRTRRTHIAYGADVRLARAISSESQAADLSRAFLIDNVGLTGVRSDNVRLANVVHARGKWASHFEQVVEGIPVVRGRAWVVLGDGGEVMAFGSDFVPEQEGLRTTPALDAARALDVAARSIAATPRTDVEVRTDLVMVPAGNGEAWELRPAYRVVFDADEPFGTWETFVDATDGAILARANLVHTVNVTGNVEGDVQDFGYCDGVVPQGLTSLRVAVSGGGNDVTDANGDFEVIHGGAAPVTVTGELRGPYLNVNRFTGLGADASFSLPATPGTPLPVFFTDANARNDERDCFQHANRAHDFVKAIEPTFTPMDFEMGCWVGRTDNICPGNAWWSPSSLTINFCAENGNSANTGEIGNVIYHEYGHGVSHRLYNAQGGFLPSGDMHEGNSDIIANFIDRNPIIGLGFSLNFCTSGIRTADNDYQWPENNDGGHFGGQIIAGFYWDAWQDLLLDKPQSEADDIAWNGWHFSRRLGLPTNQPDQVFWTFVADDDNANLADGTPNYDYWCLGASNHGFDCPEVTIGVFITHEKLPHTEDGSLGFDVVAEIVSSGSTLDPSTIEVQYRVNGGAFSAIPMTTTGNPDEFVAHIPALPQGSEVEYYVTAEDFAGHLETSPADAPVDLHAFDVAQEYDDFEAGPGAWTAGLGSDTAISGVWGLFDPVGTAAQPGDDSTPGAGTMAFITGQCGVGFESCTVACTNNCSDVDFGVTTLRSPVYDLSAFTSATIKYDRWYTNNTGTSPNFDHWVVDISNDGGTTWTNVEDTTVSDASWTSHEIDVNAVFGTPGMVRVRFRASDVGNESVVEAAVDEFRILAGSGTTGAPHVAEAAPLAFALSQNQPNPFGGATEISYALPAPTLVELSVYNVAGQVVRVLASGERAPGRYATAWDGRDETGRPVAAGLYFYRLVAGERVVTKKMTMMR